MLEMNPDLKEWKCPRYDCKKTIQAFSQKGLELAAEEHVDRHRREDQEEKERLRLATEEFESHDLPKNPRTMMNAFYKIRKDISVLYVTRTDLGFLKTRGIKIDDDIELEWRMKEE